jgi:GTPase SAR1 family protein
MREKVRLLLLGDAQVGKSSLLSAYVSRHFSEEVPHVVADANIPPGATANHTHVTIMDSSTRIGDRDVLKKKIQYADSIIALYDVTRPETLESLGKEWLPLIRDLWSQEKALSYKSVVICATKIDLLDEMQGSADDIHIEEEESKLRKLITLYPFIFATCRSSAKLLNVDSVFYFGDLVVTFPLGPLFDPVKADFTISCKRAFARICRIYDNDKDGLLSDHELSSLQYSCFENSLNDEDIMAVKRQVNLAVTGGIKHNRITFLGFIGYMHIFIDKSHTQTPWTILRHHNYDDSLSLIIPDDIKKFKNVKNSRNDQITSLSSNARLFIYKLARNTIEGAFNNLYHSIMHETVHSRSATPIDGQDPNNIEIPITDNNGDTNSLISLNALKNILSVIDSSVHPTPWDSLPVYTEEFNIDGSNDESMYLLSGILKTDDQVKLTIESFINHWEMLAVLNPSLTQSLLYRLGYAEQADKGIEVTDGRLLQPQFKYAYSGNTASTKMSRVVYRVCVIGGNSVGKTSFISKLCGIENGIEIKKDVYVHGSTCVYYNHETNTISNVGSSSNLVNIIFTEIPCSRETDWLAKHGNSCDLVVLMFSSIVDDSFESYEYCKTIESLLPNSLPRVYVANKNVMTVINNPIFGLCETYLSDSGLPDLLVISGHDSGTGISEVVKSILEISILDPNKGIPTKLRTKENRLLKTLLLIGSVTAGAAIIAATTLSFENNKIKVRDWVQSYLSSTKGFFVKSN